MTYISERGEDAWEELGGKFQYARMSALCWKNKIFTDLNHVTN